MSRILVTGGSGRLGVSVLRTLGAAGHEVTSVDHSTSPVLEVRQVEHDLRHRESTAALFREIAPDAVVHLAAVAVPFSRPDPEIFAINTSLAFSVIDATVACGADRLLVASSPTVIGYGAPGGWSPEYLPIDEDHPVAPWNGYAASKVAVEQIVQMAVRRDGHAVRFGVFRPCYVIAPEEWQGALTQQGHTVAARLDDPALSAVALFNYVDARDVGNFCDAWLGSAHDVPNGSVYFVAASDSLVREPVGEALARLVPGAAAAAAVLGPTDPVFSSARAATELGWAPRHSWRSALETAPAPSRSAREAERA